MQAIATLAGVHPPAIYRRWPSRLALIEDAAFSGLPAVAVVPTGHLRHDLRPFLQAYEASLVTPAARAALPGLLAAYQDAELPATRWMHLSVRPVFAEILRAAPADVDQTLDLDEVFDLVLGAVLARVLVPTVAARQDWVETTADHIARLVRPDATEEVPG
jgi:AcrR family transcriptional regulator